MDTNTAIQGSIYQVGSAGIEEPFPGLSDKALKAPALHPLWMRTMFCHLTPWPCLTQVTWIPARSLMPRGGPAQGLLAFVWVTSLHRLPAVMWELWLDADFPCGISYSSSGMLTLLWLLPAGMSLKIITIKSVFHVTKHYCLAHVSSFPKDRVFSFLTTCPCFPVTRNHFWESDNPLAGGALSLEVPSWRGVGSPQEGRPVPFSRCCCSCVRAGWESDVLGEQRGSLQINFQIGKIILWNNL